MDKDDFAITLEQKKQDLQRQINTEKVGLTSPGYHVEKITADLRAAVGSIDPNLAQHQVVEKLMEIINLVPRWVATGFTEKAQKVSRLQQTLSVWGEVGEEYDKIIERQLMSQRREQDILQAIEDGELDERTARTRRQPGEHPGPTTREIRKAKAQLRQSDS